MNTHGRHIESLLFPPYGAIRDGFIDGEFWTRFPKLRLLGGSIDPPDALPPLPVDHPFNYICLYEFDLQYVKKLLGNLPSLHYISVLSMDTSGKSAKQTVLVDEFLVEKSAEQLEIRLYSVEPQEFDQLRRVGSWNKEIYYPSSFLPSFMCTWELKKRGGDSA